jgi:hypothetical protein
MLDRDTVGIISKLNHRGTETQREGKDEGGMINEGLKKCLYYRVYHSAFVLSLCVCASVVNSF